MLVYNKAPCIGLGLMAIAALAQHGGVRTEWHALLMHAGQPSLSTRILYLSQGRSWLIINNVIFPEGGVALRVWLEDHPSS